MTYDYYNFNEVLRPAPARPPDPLGFLCTSPNLAVLLRLTHAAQYQLHKEYTK